MLKHIVARFSCDSCGSIGDEEFLDPDDTFENKIKQFDTIRQILELRNPPDGFVRDCNSMDYCKHCHTKKEIKK